MKANVIRPDFYSGDKVITLSATVKSGEVTKTKSFDMLVRRAPRTDEQSINEDIKYIKNNILKFVSTDIKVMALNQLPFGSAVTWATSAETYLKPDGKVIRPDFGLPSQDVTITATLTKGEKTQNVEIQVTILAVSTEDEVSAVARRITWDLIKKNNTDKTRITTDLDLPSEVETVKVVWESSNSKFLSSNGKVTRPEFKETDVQVTLTATLTKGEKRTTVTLTGLKILKKAPSSQQRCEEYTSTSSKWEHWVTANGTNRNTDLEHINEGFILPSENEDMLLTWQVVDQEGKPTDQLKPYFNISYVDDGASGEDPDPKTNGRYVVAVNRPPSSNINAYVKVTANISETTDSDKNVIPGGESSSIHTFTVIGASVEKVALRSKPTETTKEQKKTQDDSNGVEKAEKVITEDK